MPPPSLHRKQNSLTTPQHQSTLPPTLIAHTPLTCDSVNTPTTNSQHAAYVENPISRVNTTEREENSLLKRHTNFNAGTSTPDLLYGVLSGPTPSMREAQRERISLIQQQQSTVDTLSRNCGNVVGMYAGFRKKMLSISELDNVRATCEDKVKAHLAQINHCYFGMDLGSSSTMAYAITPSEKFVVKINSATDVYQTAIAFPLPTEESWDVGTGKVKLRSMLFSTAAMSTKYPTLLSYWKPFHLAQSESEFRAICKTFQFSGHGHHLIGWNGDLGLFYKYRNVLPNGAPVSEDIPMWRIENEIVRRFLEKLTDECATQGVQRAVFTMPVAHTLIQRHQRLQRLREDPALSKYVKEWHVLMESSAAFLAKTINLQGTESRMVVVDLGEGTLDISTGRYSTSRGIQFEEYLGCTDVRGTHYTDAVAFAFWKQLDATMVDVMRRRLKVKSCVQDYGSPFVQAVFDLCRMLKENLCNMGEGAVTHYTPTLLEVYEHHSKNVVGYDRVKEFVVQHPLFKYSMDEFRRDTRSVNDKLVDRIESCLKKQRWFDRRADDERCDLMVLVGRPMYNSHLVEEVKKRFEHVCGRIISYNSESQVAAGAAQGALYLDCDSSLIKGHLSTNVYLELTRQPDVGDARTLGKTMLVPMFSKGVPLPAVFKLSTAISKEGQVEIDFPIFVGDSIEDARLLSNLVLHNVQKAIGEVEVCICADETVCVIGDHGAPDQIWTRMDHVLRDIKFDPFSDEAYIDERDEIVDQDNSPTSDIANAREMAFLEQCPFRDFLSDHFFRPYAYDLFDKSDESNSTSSDSDITEGKDKNDEDFVPTPQLRLDVEEGRKRKRKYMTREQCTSKRRHIHRKQ